MRNYVNSRHLSVIRSRVSIVLDEKLSMIPRHKACHIKCARGHSFTTYTRRKIIISFH